MKQMKKDEAISKIGSINIQWDGRDGPYTAARALVESLDALGLWTPTEPKSVEDEAADAMGMAGWYMPGKLISDLKAAGFTVTKAVK